MIELILNLNSIFIKNIYNLNYEYLNNKHDIHYYNIYIELLLSFLLEDIVRRTMCVLLIYIYIYIYTYIRIYIHIKIPKLICNEYYI